MPKLLVKIKSEGELIEQFGEHWRRRFKSILWTTYMNKFFGQTILVDILNDPEGDFLEYQEFSTGYIWAFDLNWVKVIDTDLAKKLYV